MQPFYKWHSKYGGMDAPLMTRMQELEEESRRLQKMYAEERIKAEILADAFIKKVVAPSQRREWRSGRSPSALPPSC
jgi:hypothetical protein